MKASLFKGELWPVTVLKDFVLLFTDYATIKRERHDRHAFFSILIISGLFIGAVLLELKYPLQITTSPYWTYLFFGGFAAWIVNWLREAFLQKKGGTWTVDGEVENIVPFSYRDVRFGTYGGVIAAALIGALIKVII